MMRRTLLLLLLTGNTAFAQVDLKKGLVAYYPFDGNANDESVNRINPTEILVNYTSDRFDKINSACLFDGQTNYLRLPNHPALNFTTSFSISAWVMVNGFYSGKCHGNRIIMKGPNEHVKGNYFMGFSAAHATKGANCYTDKPELSKQEFYAAHAGPIADSYITPGKWHHLIYICDGKSANLYVNGKLVAFGELSGYEFSNPYDLFIGKMDNGQYPYWFNGAIDELRFYNRTLNKDEITVLCDQGDGKEQPLIDCNGANKVLADFSYEDAGNNRISFKLKGFTNDLTVKWSFGDGSFSSQKEPVHVFDQARSYKVVAAVTSSKGCGDDIVKTIHLKGKKEADGKLNLSLEPAKTTKTFDLTTGLVAWYPFNGTTRDESGKENHPATVKGTFTNDKFGNKKSAFFFNGKDDFIRIKHNTSLVPEEMTMVAIVKPMGFYNGLCYNNSILDKGAWDYVPGAYALRFTAGEYTQGDCRRAEPGHQNFVGMVSRNGGSTSKEIYVKTGTWYTIIYTYGKDYSCLYVNGELISTYPTTVPIGKNTEDLFIGHKDNEQYPYWFNGVMDEIRVYNRALKSGEVKELYRQLDRKDVDVIR